MLDNFFGITCGYLPGNGKVAGPKKLKIIDMMPILMDKRMPVMDGLEATKRD